jgi:endonuclease/exonuclease/phosphatase family metal-dependent hydrolase
MGEINTRRLCIGFPRLGLGAGFLLGVLAGGLGPTPSWAQDERPESLPVEALIADSSAAAHAPIEWIRPDDPENRSTLARWSSAVGPPVLRELDAGGAPPRLDSLLVLTWNINVGGGDLDRFILELRGGSFTAGCAPEHFVLLLQEAYRRGEAVPAAPPEGAKGAKGIFVNPPSGQRLSIDAMARKHDLALFYAPSMRNGKPGKAPVREDRGCAILSTLPLADYTAVELPAERQRRVALGAAVQLEGPAGQPWRLVLINLHLENRAPLRKWLESFGEARLRQIRFALDLLPEHTPAVCAGDFNTWFREENAKVARFARRRFPLPAELPPGGTSQLMNGLLRRMDYLLFDLPETWTVSTRRLDHRHGSDHYPLLGWIRLPPIAHEEPP